MSQLSIFADTFAPHLQIKPVQKQTRAGQRTRFKAIVIIGDSEGHVGLGIKTSKEVATAIRAAIIIAKLSVVPVRRGYWGANLGLPHSLPTKESGKCGSVTVRVSAKSETTGAIMTWRQKMLTTFCAAYPRSPWYLPRRFSRCEASAPACRY
jgi:small subunit ribosomal protein S2e